MKIKTLLKLSKLLLLCVLICGYAVIKLAFFISSAQANIYKDSIHEDRRNIAYSNAEGGNASVTENHQYRRNPANTAYAPGPIIPLSDSCVFSTGVGGSAVTFSLSFGTVFTDEDCNLRKDVDMLDKMGYWKAAYYLMCSKERFISAFKYTSIPCPRLMKVNSMCRDRRCM